MRSFLSDKVVLSWLCGLLIVGGGGFFIASSSADKKTDAQLKVHAPLSHSQSNGKRKRVTSAVETSGNLSLPDNFHFDLGRYSGLPYPDQDGPLVVVPASLIGALSQAFSLRSVEQDLFTQSGKIEQILQISDKEKSHLQRAWGSLRDQIRLQEAHAVKSESLQDGSVRITLPDLQEDTLSLGEAFIEEVNHVLGENRGLAFLSIKQVEKIFSMSRGERVYTIKVESVGDGHCRYHMAYQSQQGRKVWVGDHIPKEIRHITDAAKIDPVIDSE